MAPLGMTVTWSVYNYILIIIRLWFNLLMTAYKVLCSHKKTPKIFSLSELSLEKVVLEANLRLTGLD